MACHAGGGQACGDHSGRQCAYAELCVSDALDFVRQLELAEQDASGHLDYQNVMAPDLQTFCHMAKLPAAPNALSDAGYMFTLSGADLIRDIYAYCSELAERHVFDAAEVKPGYVIKPVLRLFLMDGFGAMPA